MIVHIHSGDRNWSIDAGEFEEGKHPRGKGGQWAKGGTGRGGLSGKPTRTPGSQKSRFQKKKPSITAQQEERFGGKTGSKPHRIPGSSRIDPATGKPEKVDTERYDPENRTASAKLAVKGAREELHQLQARRKSGEELTSTETAKLQRLLRQYGG